MVDSLFLLLKAYFSLIKCTLTDILIMISVIWEDWFWFQVVVGRGLYTVRPNHSPVRTVSSNQNYDQMNLNRIIDSRFRTVRGLFEKKLIVFWLNQTETWIGLEPASSIKKKIILTVAGNDQMIVLPLMVKNDHMTIFSLKLGFLFYFFHSINTPHFSFKFTQLSQFSLNFLSILSNLILSIFFQILSILILFFSQFHYFYNNKWKFFRKIHFSIPKQKCHVW